MPTEMIEKRVLTKGVLKSPPVLFWKLDFKRGKNQILAIA